MLQEFGKRMFQASKETSCVFIHLRRFRLIVVVAELLFEFLLLEKGVDSDEDVDEEGEEFLKPRCCCCCCCFSKNASCS